MRALASWYFPAFGGPTIVPSRLFRATRHVDRGDGAMAKTSMMMRHTEFRIRWLAVGGKEEYELCVAYVLC